MKDSERANKRGATEEGWSRREELTISGISQQLNSIDQDIIMRIPHIIELGLLDLQSHYLVKLVVVVLGGHNRIYHYRRLEGIIILHHLGVRLLCYNLSW